MKRIIQLVLLAALCWSGLEAATPLTPRQKKEVIARLNKASAGIRTMSCGFTQTKHLSLLSDKMVSEGRMYYRQPDRLRWEYTSPYSYQFVFNGGKAYVGGNKRKDVIDTKSNRLFREIASIMMSTVTGKALSDSGSFTVDVADEKSQWAVTLIPRKKELRNMFRKIVLHFGKEDNIISGITLYEKNNDRTHIRLRGLSTNGKINESMFAIPQ